MSTIVHPTYNEGDLITVEEQDLVVTKSEVVETSHGPRLLIEGRKPRGSRIQLATQDLLSNGKWSKLKYYELNWRTGR